MHIYTYICVCIHIQKIIRCICNTFFYVLTGLHFMYMILLISLMSLGSATSIIYHTREINVDLKCKTSTSALVTCITLSSPDTQSSLC